MTWVDYLTPCLLTALLTACVMLRLSNRWLREQSKRYLVWADKAVALQDAERREWLRLLATHDPQTAEMLTRRMQGWPL